MGLFGLLLLVIVVASAAAAVTIAAGRRRADQATLLWTIVLAVEKRLPLDEELVVLSQSLTGAAARRTDRLAGLLTVGHSLADALDRVPGAVPADAVLAVHVGEVTGRTAPLLRETAVRLSARSRPRWRTFWLGFPLLYLWLVPMTLVLMAGYLLYWVAPRYMKIFEDFGFSLPEESRKFFQTAGSLEQAALFLTPLLMLPVAAIVVLAIGYYRGWDDFNVPLTGRLFRRTDAAGILRLLAACIEAGAPLEDAVEVLSLKHHRRATRDRLQLMLRSVLRGENPWRSLRDAGLLKGHEEAALQAAARAGNLPFALRELADTIVRRRVYRWRAAGEIVQPALVVALGVCVLLFMRAFFLPLTSLMEQVQSWQYTRPQAGINQMQVED